MNASVIRVVVAIAVMLITVIAQTNGFARIRAKLLDKQKQKEEIELNVEDQKQ